MNEQFSREERLIGKENLEKLAKTKVAIFGIGGVGSFVAEGLARAGIGNFLLVDNDTIDITNINRQIHANINTVGKNKVDIMKERILVTGGTGYIGSHTVVELQNSGYDVVIVDNLSNSSADVVDNIEKVSGIRPAFEKLDCLDLEGMDKLFTKYPGIKGIIHFAASKAVGESVQKPLLYYRNNLVSLINLLELMPKHGVEGIIFSSSCTVYGQPDVLPVTEEAPIKKAESPYGNTKQINEERAAEDAEMEAFAEADVEETEEVSEDAFKEVEE